MRTRQISLTIAIILSLSLLSPPPAAAAKRFRFSLCSLLFTTMAVSIGTGAFIHVQERERAEAREFAAEVDIMYIVNAAKKAVKKGQSRDAAIFPQASKLIGGGMGDQNFSWQRTNSANQLLDIYGTPIKDFDVQVQRPGEEVEPGFVYLSAGPDRKFGTNDDIGCGTVYATVRDHPSIHYSFRLESDDDLKGVLKIRSPHDGE